MNSPADAAIRRQVQEDAAAVRDVIGRAFDGEPEVVALEEALAQRSDSTGYVALVDDRVVGHVRLTRGWIDAETRLVDVLVLSPLSVAPEWQSRGIGRALVAHAVAEAKRAGVPAVFLEGDPAYYVRLGWRPASELGVTPPSARIPERACQAVPLPGGLAAATLSVLLMVATGERRSRCQTRHMVERPGHGGTRAACADHQSVPRRRASTRQGVVADRSGRSPRGRAPRQLHTTV